MLRWAVRLMKLVMGGCVIWQTSQYVVDHYPSYYPDFPVEIETWCSLLLIGLSAGIFLVALAFVNEGNIARVLANWAIIVCFTALAWFFGNAIASESRDRFERTLTSNYCLICAMIGAAMGYVVCLMREPSSEFEESDVERDELEADDNQLHSDQLVDMAHD